MHNASMWIYARVMARSNLYNFALNDSLRENERQQMLAAVIPVNATKNMNIENHSKKKRIERLR